MWGRKKDDRVEVLESKLLELRKDLNFLNDRVIKSEDQGQVEIAGLKAGIANATATLKNELASIVTKFNDSSQCLANDVEKRFIYFHKEVTDKYFTTLENIFRWNREISLMESVGRFSENGFAALKKAILGQASKANVEASEKMKGAAIDGKLKGYSLFKKRQALSDELLKLERENKDIRHVKGQIAMIDEISGGIK